MGPANPTGTAGPISPVNSRGTCPALGSHSTALQFCEASALIYRPKGKAQGVGCPRAPAARVSPSLPTNHLSFLPTLPPPPSASLKKHDHTSCSCSILLAVLSQDALADQGFLV